MLVIRLNHAFFAYRNSPVSVLNSTLTARAVDCFESCVGHNTNTRVVLFWKFEHAKSFFRQWANAIFKYIIFTPSKRTHFNTVVVRKTHLRYILEKSIQFGIQDILVKLRGPEVWSITVINFFLLVYDFKIFVGTHIIFLTFLNRNGTGSSL